MNYEMLPNIIDPKILNIFCDGSIKDFNGTTIGCAGAIGFSGNENVCWYFDTVPAATNNITELVAIYCALNLAKSHKQLYKTINIFSDSKLCVFSLLQWFEGWFLNANNNGVLYNTSGEEVKNQEYIKCLIKYIVENDLVINLYHQKGHVSLQSKDSFENARFVFMVSNRLSISDQQLKYISKYNDLIDRKTKAHLEYISHPNAYSIRPEMPFIPIINDEDLEIYSVAMGINNTFSKDIEMETF